MNAIYYQERQKKLDTLNHKKRMLEFQTNIIDSSKFANDFLQLAGEYAALDARANQAHCMNRYYHYSGTNPESIPVENGLIMLEAALEQKPFVPDLEIDPDPPEPEFAWQDYTE